MASRAKTISSSLPVGACTAQEDPYLALGLASGGSGAGGGPLTESDVKKSYRRCALRYHPDKTQNKTGLLFTVVQVLSRNPHQFPSSYASEATIARELTRAL